MKHLLVGLLVAGCGAATTPLTEIETRPTNAGARKATRSYEGFPIPDDAEDRGSGSEASHELAIPRPRDEVYEELSAQLQAEGWRVRAIGLDPHTAFRNFPPRMSEYPFYAAKGDKIYRVTIAKLANNAKREATAMSIVTQPLDQDQRPVTPKDVFDEESR